MNPPRNLNLKQYFTEAQSINALMCQLLGSVDGLSVLEPSVGHGALLKGLHGVPLSIDAIDVDESALDVVRRESMNNEISLHHCDFIDIVANSIFSDKHIAIQKLYDAVISNPPYGLSFSIEYRKLLKQVYPNLYVKESYGLFFIFSISQLKEGGRYVFLIPDTFLTSKNHTPLREFICSQAAPTHIIRFPSKKFETINFGYGNLCIIAGTKSKVTANNNLLWLDATDPKVDIFDLARENINDITGKFLLSNINNGWSSTRMTNELNSKNKWPTLGDIAECRTGIYTGDNVKYIGFDPHRVKRRLNGHPIAWKDSVNFKTLNEDEKINGINGNSCYVPLIRGGHRDCFDQTSSAIKWSTDAISFYKTDKKARFQNSKYYFSKGLSVPMVSSGRISAALMESSVFDQGVVGVFPRDEKYIAPLLIYLNSTFASKLMKGMVNGSANNSANYLKKLPIPEFNESQIEKASEILKFAKNSNLLQQEICNKFIDEVTEEITTLST